MAWNPFDINQQLKNAKPKANTSYDPWAVSNALVGKNTSSAMYNGVVQGAGTQAVTNNNSSTQENHNPATVSVPKIDFDAIYNPHFDNLKQQEKMINNTEIPNALAQIESTKKVQNNLLDTQDLNAENTLNKHSRIASETRQTALDEAIRAYNALSQSNRSRFGGGSSAGQAIGELVQQEFFRQQGATEKRHTNSIDALLEQRSQVAQFVGQKRYELEEWSNLEVARVKENFEKKLMEINSQRATLQSQKAQQKSQLLIDTTAMFNEIRMMRETANTQLQSFKAQHDYAVTGRMKEIYANPVDTSNVMDGFKGYGVNPQTSGSAQFTNVTYNPSTGQYEDEESNPFFL